MKFTFPDTTLLINKKVKVFLNTKKKEFLIGKLKSTDTFMNCALVDVIDHCDLKYESCVIRGEYIANILVHR